MYRTRHRYEQIYPKKVTFWDSTRERELFPRCHSRGMYGKPPFFSALDVHHLRHAGHFLRDVNKRLEIACHLVDRYIAGHGVKAGLLRTGSRS